jgi:hypothetical protein
MRLFLVFMPNELYYDLESMAPNCRMIHDWLIEGICKEPVVMWSTYSLGICLEGWKKTEENLNDNNNPTEIQTEYLTNTSHDYYRDIDPFCSNVLH